MKKRFTITSVLFLILTAFLCASAFPVHAAKRERIYVCDIHSDKMTIMLGPDCDMIYGVFPKMKYECGVGGAVSSNPSVVAIDSVGLVEDLGFCIRPIKPGCAKITVDIYTIGSTKRYKKVMKVRVVKFTCPFKTFKIGKTNVKTLFGNKFNYSKMKFPLGKAFFNIKCNKGWRLNKKDSNLYGRRRYAKNLYGSQIIREMPNQRIFNFNAKNIKWDNLSIMFENPKYGIYMYYSLDAPE